MSLLDERGTGAISWQRNLAILWCGVFFACLFIAGAAC